MRLMTSTRVVKNPLAFCHTVARRMVIRERYPFVGHREEEGSRKGRVLHVSPGPNEAQRRDAVFGSVPATALDRVIAREGLRRLEMLGLGNLIQHGEL